MVEISFLSNDIKRKWLSLNFWKRRKKGCCKKEMRNVYSHFSDEDLLIAEDDVWKIIHIVDGFVLWIDVVVGEVRPVKFFSIKHRTCNFLLCTIFTHYLQQDRSVAVEDFVYTFRSGEGDFVEFDMILRLTCCGIKYFISSTIRNQPKDPDSKTGK